VDEFCICRGYARDLTAIAESASELATIRRLEEFRGDEQDVRVAAAMYERVGEHANALTMLRMIKRGGGPDAC